MLNFIAVNRHRLELDLLGSPRRQYLSAVMLSQYRVTVPLMREYLHGAMIDLGCGLMPYRPLLEAYVTRYDSLDPRPQGPAVTYQLDIQDMHLISEAAYDSAICLEVLEHVPDPFRAMAEIHRILKPEGIVILSTPHLSRLHELPNDFFRFTEYGLRAMLQKTGFEVVRIAKRGGLFSFLSHQISLVILGLTWSIPGVRQVVFCLNEWLCVRLAYSLDGKLDASGLFAAGYTCVARKMMRHKA